MSIIKLNSIAQVSSVFWPALVYHYVQLIFSTINNHSVIQVTSLKYPCPDHHSLEMGRRWESLLLFTSIHEIKMKSVSDKHWQSCPLWTKSSSSIAFMEWGNVCRVTLGLRLEVFGRKSYCWALSCERHCYISWYRIIFISWMWIVNIFYKGLLRVWWKKAWNNKHFLISWVPLWEL